MANHEDLISKIESLTVVELADLPMARGVPPLVGSFYADLHRERGVDLRTSTSVRRITDENGRALVHTDDGEAFLADAVVVGIGVIPNVDLAQGLGSRSRTESSSTNTAVPPIPGSTPPAMSAATSTPCSGAAFDLNRGRTRRIRRSPWRGTSSAQPSHTPRCRGSGAISSI